MQAQQDSSAPTQAALAKVVDIILQARERRLQTNEGQEEKAKAGGAGELKPASVSDTDTGVPT